MVDHYFIIHVQKSHFPHHDSSHHRMNIVSKLYKKLITKEQDSIDDLLQISISVDLIEATTKKIADRCTALRHDSATGMELAVEKSEIVHDWEDLEDRLLGAYRQLKCVVQSESDGENANERLIASKLGARIEFLLDEGSNLITSLSASAINRRRASHNTPTHLKTNQFIESVSNLEMNESKCRIEFMHAEDSLRTNIINKSSEIASQLLSTCRGMARVVNSSKRNEKKSIFAIPPEWGTAMTSKSSWCGQHSDVVDVTVEVKADLDNLFSGIGGVTSVHRIESVQSWSQYVSRRQVIQSEISNDQNKKIRRQLLTTLPEVLLSGKHNWELDDSINEKWVLLPCPRSDTVTNIVSKGNQAVVKSSGLFGKGLYLVESAARVDQAVAGFNSCAILGRVVLGVPAVTDTPSPSMTSPPEGYHSLVVNSKNKIDPMISPPPSDTAWLSLHREFILHNPTGFFPAYIIEYKRVPSSIQFQVSYEG